MPHFLIQKNDVKEGFIFVSDKETVSHLVSSLRIKEGEAVKFIDENETVYTTEILNIRKSEIKGKILSEHKSTRKLDLNLCVLISVLKPEAMNLAIQNAVQLGAKEIYTVYSNNCAVNKNSVLNKAEKWKKIGYESFKQCERADMPKVFEVMEFDEIFAKFKKENILIFAEKNDKLTVKDALKTCLYDEKILLVFGPEGGFSNDEFKKFEDKNLKLVTLGRLILKAPNAVTAGLFGVQQWMTL